MDQSRHRSVLLISMAMSGCWCDTASAQTDDNKTSIEQLLKSGWQVAGYTSTFDNRSALILLKHIERELSGSMLGRLRCAADATRLRQLLRTAVRRINSMLNRS